jgi:hypothetical protein
MYAVCFYMRLHTTYSFFFTIYLGLSQDLEKKKNQLSFLVFIWTLAAPNLGPFADSRLTYRSAPQSKSEKMLHQQRITTILPLLIRYTICKDVLISFIRSTTHLRSLSLNPNFLFDQENQNPWSYPPKVPLGHVLFLLLGPRTQKISLLLQIHHTTPSQVEVDTGEGGPEERGQSETWGPTFTFEKSYA